MEDADVHSERADQHRAAAAAAEREDSGLDRANHYVCGDTGLSDQVTSGGERLIQTVPCWDATEEYAAHQRYLAGREQHIARVERREATSMVVAELDECRGLSGHELEHSPLAHQKEIAAVIPHRDAGVLRGVRIVFKPIPGLTADWMRQSIACQRARFERLGQPASYLADDPTLLVNSTVTVERRGGHVEVQIVSPDAASARIALDRAEDLIHPRTADRL